MMVVLPTGCYYRQVLMRVAMDLFNHKLRLAQKAHQEFLKEKEDYVEMAGFCPYDPFLRGFAYGYEANKRGLVSRFNSFIESAIEWITERIHGQQ